MKIKDVIDALDGFAPLPLQEDFDNAGLQVGLTEAEVSGALLCLEATEQIVDEAVEKGCNLIVTHHPLIFHKLRQVSDADYVQRTVMKAIRHDITIVSMHTNLDSAEGGVNYMIARRLGADMQSVKLLGEHEVNGIMGGLGIVCQLPEAMGAADFIDKVKETFGVKVAMTNELLQRPVKRVAICGGAGSFMLPQAVEAQADAFLTGEMHYHEYFGHEQEIQIVVIGHYESEQYTINLLEEIIKAKCPEVRTCMTELVTNPIIVR
ncbi:MAG: Nif3-like dinuclear metal center hexameric protein [Prevotella sp.]|nr:Nif3-like dinuclear metal center hexameric protein [Prevotella sp.]